MPQQKPKSPIVPIVIVLVCLSIMAGAGFAFWWFLIRVSDSGPAPAPAYEPPPLGDYMLTPPAEAPGPESPSPYYDGPSAAPGPWSPSAPGPGGYGPPPAAAPGPVDYGSDLYDPLLCLPDPTLGSIVKGVNFWGGPVDENSEYRGGMAGVGECCKYTRDKNMKGYVYNSKTGECWTKNMSRTAMADGKTQIVTTGFDDNVVVSFESTQMGKLTEGTIDQWRNKL